jgi:cytochrome c-type biogenesis protein CcmH/NrfG
MRIWPALIGAPLAALAQQSILLALATPSCSRQSTSALHAVSVVVLLLVAAASALAVGEWQRRHGPGDGRRRLLAAVAAWTGGLSALASLAMWVPVWVISPCIN